MRLGCTARLSESMGEMAPFGACFRADFKLHKTIVEDTVYLKVICLTLIF